MNNKSNLISINVENNYDGTIILIKENFNKKPNKYCAIMLTLDDLSDFYRVGEKLELLGKMIKNEK